MTHGAESPLLEVLIWGISTVEAKLTGAGTNLAFSGFCRPLPLDVSGSSQMSRGRSGFRSGP